MTFSQDLAKFYSKTSRKLDLLVKKVVIDMGTRIVLRTPVGNPELWKSEAPIGYVGGRARANWQYGTGEMPSGILDTIDLGGNNTVNKIVGGVQASKSASIHWVANNLPYIKRLEEGWSTQAPQGMLRLTVLEFEPTIRDALKNVN